MKKDANHIDQTFRNGLAHSEITPPSFVWDSIEKKLSTQRKQKRVLMIWQSISAAAIIGVLFLVSLFWQNHTNNNQPLSLNKLTKEAHSSIQNQNTFNTPSTKNINSLNKEIKATKQKNKTTYFIKTTSLKKNQSTISTIENKPGNNNSTQFISDSLLNKKLGKNNVTLKNYAQINVNQLFNHLNKNEISFSNTNRTYINPFINTDHSKEKKNLQIALGGHFSPGYSYREASSTDNFNNSATQESGITSYTGGINLNFKTPKRWSFETGIYYAQVGQKFSNPMSQVSAPAYYSALSTKKTSPDNSSNMNNSLGNIKLNPKYEKQFQDKSFELPQLSFGDALNSTKEIELLTIQQELDYIEIPFLMRYDVTNKSIIVSLSGGVSTDFLIGNNAYQLVNNSKENIGETQNINNINYTAIFGVGFRTAIWKSIEFNLEPKVRYFMNSVTNGDANNYHPYTIGIYTGISYRFK